MTIAMQFTSTPMDLNLLHYISLSCTVISTAAVIMTLITYYLLKKRVTNFFYELSILVIVADIPLLAMSYVFKTENDIVCGFIRALGV